jgi:hypothetical protein
MAMLRKRECDVEKGECERGAEGCPNNIFAPGRPKPSRRYIVKNFALNSATINSVTKVLATKSKPLILLL